MSSSPDAENLPVLLDNVSSEQNRVTQADWSDALESDEVRILPFEFNADWKAYWRIWIVNVALSILTLGIYSAWAKVRSKRYFYGHVSLQGSSFDYHGRPLAILRGRLIAVALFAIWLVCTQIGPAWVGGALLVFLLILPWLVVKAAAFRAYNTSWRGLRFGFFGKTGAAFVRFTLPWMGILLGTALSFWLVGRIVRPNQGGAVLFVLLIVIAAYLSYAAVLTVQKRFMVDHHRFGRALFCFGGTAGGLLGIYLLTLLLFIPLNLIKMPLDNALEWTALQVFPTLMQYFSSSWLMSSTGKLFMLLVMTPAIVLASSPLLFGLGYLRGKSMIWQWENTRLGTHAFRCNINPWMLATHYFGNAVVIALSLGLLIPWAITRTARLRAQSMQFVCIGSLDDWLSANSQSNSALGDEVGDIVGLDVGI
jgi:uncharacterized membrane protein YjgN (DUF898 family)